MLYCNYKTFFYQKHDLYNKIYQIDKFFKYLRINIYIKI